MSSIHRQLGMRALIAMACLFGTTAAARASEPTVDQCLKASESGQRLRDAGQFVRARQTWNTCTSTSCPAMVRQDCAAWIADLERSMPSVIVAVRTQDGHDVQNARISLDGASEPLTGRAMALDPGEHTIVVEGPGFARTTERVFVNATEKNRLVVVRVAAEAAPAPPPAPPSSPPSPSPSPSPSPTASGASGPPAATWVLGGVGVVALGGSVVLGLAGRGQLSDAEHAPCAATKSCDESIRTSARTKLVLADVALGVGVAALGAGILWWVVQPSPQTAAAPMLRIGARGANVVAEGAF